MHSTFLVLAVLAPFVLTLPAPVATGTLDLTERRSNNISAHAALWHSNKAPENLKLDIVDKRATHTASAKAPAVAASSLPKATHTKAPASAPAKSASQAASKSVAKRVPQAANTTTNNPETTLEAIASSQAPAPETTASPTPA